jgi:DNA-binding response OmpR family regulator
MAEPARILVVDDLAANVRLLCGLLEGEGYSVATAHNGASALASIHSDPPDLVLLDVVMPGMSGLEVCRALRAEPHLAMLPIVLVTALDPDEERVRGLEAGADDFIGKPFNQAELLARVRSLLRVKSLYDTVQLQAAQLQQWNDALQARVAQQVAEVERLSRLKRFLAPQVAAALLADDGPSPLVSHRREIVVVFVDLRGFTAFAEQSEPEDLMRALGEYHESMGKLCMQHGATLERFTGDAIMMFFNDPIPIAQPAHVACRMALAMRDAARALTERWRRRGFTLGAGIGIAQGFATLGSIGFEDRRDYAAIGTVTNVAARLCAEAQANEILLAERVFSEVDRHAVGEPLGPLQLRGFARAQMAYRLLTFTEGEPLTGSTVP